ncbi:MAG: cadmium-translocating P-type ATPase [Sphingobacteriales bacterium]|nr:cadmium-translocating P-type ATPase [Sphingobacteriales bacterium]
MQQHQHLYDKDGKQLCCTLEDKIYSNAQELIEEQQGGEEDHDHQHHIAKNNIIQLFFPAAGSLFLLLLAVYFDHFLQPAFFTGQVRLLWYILAYMPVGFPVIKSMFESLAKGEIFSEFILMVIATTGAFAIGQYPEGVAVMLFYAIGELFQTLAVKRAKGNIKALLDQRPDQVTILRNNAPISIKAENVSIGDIIQLKAGEKLALDGELLSENASFNTAALTGESQPDTKQKGETVLAGMINLNTVALIKATKAYKDSKLSKILELVQNASSQKAPTELFIRKFAKYYTPIVVLLAVLICLVPSFFVSDYHFRDWLYRALIFLVISCPCALVISIPLGYFGGIGAASRKGILFKVSNFLDIMANIKQVVMDKTGTLTEGVFKVQEVVINSDYNKTEILDWVNALESHSTHPVASAVHEYVGAVNSDIHFENIEEIAGQGLKATLEGKEILVGNLKLLNKHAVVFPQKLYQIPFTLIAIAYNQVFIGYLTVADTIKDDAAEAVKKLHRFGVKIMMLSGDKTAVVQAVASQLNIHQAFGELLPEDKVDKVKEIKAQNEQVAFVGDGVNDAPVIALSDVGIAMGGLGSDATIETADIVIQDDRPSKIPMAIEIGKATKRIVWQNISMAFAVKFIVLILGAGGIATMWEAVFADVGVALLAIANAIRIQKMKF